MRWAAALLGAALAVMTPSPAGAVEVDEIFADPQAWDGRGVVVTGELVGDYGRHGGRVWVQLNDDPYARQPLLESGQPMGTNRGIGVLVPAHLADEAAWGTPGRFGTHGPVVEVRGVFRHNDPLEGGDTYVEATAVRLLTPSRPVEQPTSHLTLVIGLGLVLAGGGIALDTRRRQASR